MDTNSWHYTLSAIPQTLGALIALVGTFIVFKLNLITTRLDNECAELRLWLLPLNPSLGIDEAIKLDQPGVLEQLSSGIAQLDHSKPRLGLSDPHIAGTIKYDSLVDLFRSVITAFHRYFEPDENRIYMYLNEKKDTLKKLIDDKKKTIWFLILNLILGAVTISLSLIFLPLYQCIQPYHCYVVWGLVAFATVTVVFAGFSIFKIAKL